MASIAGRQQIFQTRLRVALALVALLGSGAAQSNAGSPPAAPVPIVEPAPEPVTPAIPGNLGGGFGLDRIESLQVPFLGNPLWQYLAVLAWVALALLLSRLVDHLLRGQLRRLALQSATPVDDIVLELSRRPVRIVVFVLILQVGLKVFSWPDWAVAYVSMALKGVVGLSIAYLALKLVDVALEIWQLRLRTADDGEVGMQLLPVVRKSLRFFVVIVAALVTMQNVGMDVTGLLASLSIGGLALGLAAQDTLSNLFGAVALHADRPFRVGDRVQLDAIDGTVEAIGLRSTRIRNLDGFLVTVPNRTMANASLTNVSHRPSIKTEMNIGVTYETSAEEIERAMQLIDGIYRPHPKTADLIVSFNKFESSSLNILVVHWWGSTDVREYLANFQGLNLELKRVFDLEGIQFAFPTQTVHFKPDLR